jgi:hypothetical protein
MPAYKLEIQARIPAALCALHNFIRIHKAVKEILNFGHPDEDTSFDGTNLEWIPEEGAGNEEPQCRARRDAIAQNMWDDYTRICAERGIDDDDSDLDA